MPSADINQQLACIFPGQGSQSLGMMQLLGAEFDHVNERFEAASSILGFDLWALVTDGPQEALNRTQNTQPALLAASVATWDIWQACGGPRPRVMAGHSFGEYTALVCAGALDYATAIALVADRGRFMQEAVPPGEGAMAAILGLDVGSVGQVCVEATGAAGLCACANLNAPGQIVIAGTRAGVERACELARERGAKKALMLPVSAPVHCDLMRPAADKLSIRLEATAVKPPDTTIIHNVDVSDHQHDGDIRSALVRQMYSPVRWIETIELFSAQGITHLIECGPGKVLSALVKRIDRSLDCQALADGAGIRARIEQLAGGSA